MKTILFGNGVNRTFPGFPTWKDLLHGIHDNVSEIETTNTLQYENIYFQAVDDQWFGDADGKEESLLKKSVNEWLRQKKWVEAAQNSPVYQKLAEINVDHYLTTNYEGYLLDLFGKKNVLRGKYSTETLYSIRRNYSILNGIKHYWPIHGEGRIPKTIMLGMDQYGGSLGKISEYVKGGYRSMLDTLGIQSADATISKRLANGIDETYSWIDLFFTSDVHIIGLGLGYDEIDLWWLLTYRRRLKLKRVPVNNRIVYYYLYSHEAEASSMRGMLSMLKALDVEVSCKKVNRISFENGYLRVLDEIQRS